MLRCRPCIDLHTEWGPDENFRSLPVSPSVLSSQGLIWKKGQSGLKFQNISGESSLRIALHFTQVQDQPPPHSSRTVGTSVLMVQSFWAGSRIPASTDTKCLRWAAASEGLRSVHLIWSQSKMPIFYFSPWFYFMYIIPQKNLYIF